MKKLKITLAVLISVMCIFMSACNNADENQIPSEPYQKEIFALDTFITLKIYSENGEESATLAESQITELEDMLSVTNSESDVYKINSNGGNSTTVNDDTMNVLKTAEEISARTEGSLDITVYPIVKLWGFTTDENRVPSQSEIDSALKNVDYTKVILNESDKSVLLSENMQIDLGAIAKGYISQKVKDLLKENGVESAVLSFGGNIQTIGTKNGGQPWQVGVKYPFTQDSFVILSVEDTAVVTSATDQRYFEENGKSYHHIIDPYTGYPVDNGNFSVTVVCDDGARADGLSTAIFVMGEERAEQLYRESDDFEFIILDENDNVYITEGLKDIARLSDYYQFLNVNYIEK